MTKIIKRPNFRIRVPNSDKIGHKHPKNIENVISYHAFDAGMELHEQLHEMAREYLGHYPKKTLFNVSLYFNSDATKDCNNPSPTGVDICLNKKRYRSKKAENRPLGEAHFEQMNDYERILQILTWPLQISPTSLETNTRFTFIRTIYINYPALLEMFSNAKSAVFDAYLSKLIKHEMLHILGFLSHRRKIRPYGAGQPN